MVEDWSVITLRALQNLVEGFLVFIPQLIIAVIVFIVGWFIAVWGGRFVSEVLNKLKFDVIFEKTKWEEALEKAEFKMKMSDFIGGIVKWILAIVFLAISVEILGLTQFAVFLKAIVNWLPNLIIAVAIFIVAVILADFSEKLVKAVVGKMEIKNISLIGSIVKGAIWVFAILAILSQLGIAEEIIRILIGGFVALIVISCSIAFGLGGKDLAREFLEDLRDTLKK